jgi:predicted RNA-binding protein
VCESNAYLIRGEKEDLFLEDVTVVRPEADEIFLQNLFGEERRIKGRIKEINLASHRLLLEAD